MSDDNLVDFEAAADRLPGGDDMLREMASLLVTESKDLVDRMTSAFQNGQAIEVQRAAHTLKSAAYLFEVTPVMDQSRQIEVLAEAGELGQAESLLAALRNDVERMQAILGDYLSAK